MMGISVGHVLGMHVYINMYRNIYMYTQPTTHLRGKKKKLVKELQSPHTPSSYPGKTISSSAGGIMCMG